MDSDKKVVFLQEQDPEEMIAGKEKLGVHHYEEPIITVKPKMYETGYEPKTTAKENIYMEMSDKGYGPQKTIFVQEKRSEHRFVPEPQKRKRKILQVRKNKYSSPGTSDSSDDTEAIPTSTKIQSTLQILLVLALVPILGITGSLLMQQNQSTNDTSAMVRDSMANMVEEVTQIVSQLLSQNNQSSSDLNEFVNEVTRGNAMIQAHINQLVNMTTDAAGKVDNARNLAEERLVLSQNDTDLIGRVIATTTGSSARKLTDIVGTLSNLNDTSTSTAGVIADLLGVVEELVRLQNMSLSFSSNEPVSCQAIKTRRPNSPSGFYSINNSTIYCNMEELCGSGGGWTRLAYLDMSDATENCPSGF